MKTEWEIKKKRQYGYPTRLKTVAVKKSRKMMR